MPAVALLDVQELADFVGERDDSQHPLLEVLQREAIGIAERPGKYGANRYLGEPADQVEIRSGGGAAGARVISVCNPVRALVSIETRAVDTWTAVDDLTRYEYRGNRIRAVGSELFPAGRMNVRITYSAGQDVGDPDADVRAWIREYVQHKWRARATRTGSTSPRRTRPDAYLPTELQDVLASLRQPGGA